MRRVRLVDELARLRADLADPEGSIASGHVFVDGASVTNPASMVVRGASIVVREPTELRGSAKLRAAFEGFAVAADGRVCLDVGAATGGFSTALLDAGAAKVYAVDAGHGQLLGRLRQDPRVVNLESTNVAELSAELIDEAIGLVTVDVSYLSLADAAAQLDRVPFAPGAELVGLVKPMFELRLATAPSDRASLDEALDRAVAGVEAAGWWVEATMDSPHPGAKGAPELFLHARRSTPESSPDP